MKDPAALFYFNDWMGGTATMSRHLKGCYIDLLCVQFNNGPLSLDEIKTVLGSDFGSSWPALQKKFRVVDGLYYNERLQIEQDRRSNFTESRRKSGAYAKHTLKRMEDRNEDRDINEIKSIHGEFQKVKLSSAEHLKLIERFGDKNALILIDELDRYIASSNKKYASHYATLLNWARRKITEHQNKLQPKTRTLA